MVFIHPFRLISESEWRKQKKNFYTNFLKQLIALPRAVNVYQINWLNLLKIDEVVLGTLTNKSELFRGLEMFYSSFKVAKKRENCFNWWKKLCPIYFLCFYDVHRNGLVNNFIGLVNNLETSQNCHENSFSASKFILNKLIKKNTFSETKCRHFSSNYFGLRSGCFFSQ